MGKQINVTHMHQKLLQFRLEIYNCTVRFLLPQETVVLDYKAVALKIVSTLI